MNQQQKLDKSIQLPLLDLDNIEEEVMLEEDIDPQERTHYVGRICRQCNKPLKSSIGDFCDNCVISWDGTGDIPF